MSGRYLSRTWACAHCGKPVRDEADAWTVEPKHSGPVPVHDECIDAYCAEHGMKPPKR